MPQILPVSSPALTGAQLRPWLSETLLPFWASTGFDADHGAFVEKFEAEGRPSREDYTRVRVQARQIFVFAHAAAAGFSGVGLERAQSAFAFLEAHAWDRTQGGWFHRLSRSGQPLDRTKDCYDHAFLLLALAALYRAGGDAAVLRHAEATAAFLEAALGQTREGAFDGYAERQVVPGEPTPLPRRQNPHMHLLEAFLALYEASGEARWLERARRLHDLFHRHFYSDGQLVEFFDADWREVPHGGSHAGRLREPGHFFEWAWLLHRYATLSGDAAAATTMRPLYDWAWQHGVDREGGAPWVAFEQLDSAGHVLAGGSKRLWPQCEAVKAALAVHERFGNGDALERAQRLLGGLFTTFAGLDRPDWREQVDRDGNVIREGMPASSLYHLYLAVAESARVLPGA
jgi:mannose/cellobiose epimerase-like protein (N-acyl-D-glucosamine 2-epimerase family)